LSVIPRHKTSSFRRPSSTSAKRKTDEFRQHLSQRPSLWRTTPLSGPDGGDRFNVKKEDGVEPDLWVRRYRVEF
jgi:hypothetical protein